jgi:hypothetical protein
MAPDGDDRVIATLARILQRLGDQSSFFVHHCLILGIGRGHLARRLAEQRSRAE